MPVITRDVLIQGFRRDDLLDWISDLDNHDRILQGSFHEVNRTGDREWEFTLKTSIRTWRIGYVFESVDMEHGGRRLLCRTVGKRVDGKLHYSLRTMKPSTNTMVTLHADYSSGTVLGRMLNQALIQETLEAGYQRILDNLEEAVANR